MAKLSEIVAAIDQELRHNEIEDYKGAHNGLQLENSGEVKKVYSAVDASLAVIEEIQEQGGLLLVHHGMFWQGVQPLTGAFRKKIKHGIESDLAIYSSHLPLDVHPELGNNFLLAEKIGLKDIRPEMIKKGFPMAVSGSWDQSIEELAAAVDRATNRESTKCLSAKRQPDRVLVITGGAGSQMIEADLSGFSTFVTGEGSHWSIIEAEEREMNVFYAGHYATETFGVRCLGDWLASKFELPHSFIPQRNAL